MGKVKKMILKRFLILMMIFCFVASVAFLNIGCKEESAEAEEAVEEAVEEEVVEEETTEEETEEAVEEEVEEGPPPVTQAELGGDPDLEADLVFWGWDNAVPEAVYEAFKQYYPKVNIEFIGMGSSDMKIKLYNTMIAGTGGPDIFMNNVYEYPRFWETGGVADLTEFVADYEPYFSASYWAISTSPEGALWSVPWARSPNIMYYRSDLFDKYEIDINGIKTWADYIEAGEKLVENSDGKVKMHIYSTLKRPNGGLFALSQYQQILSYQKGALWFDASGNIVMDSPENVEVMQLWLDMKDAGILWHDVASGELERATINANNAEEDSIATWIGPSWYSGYFTKLYPENIDTHVWKTTNMPAFEEGGARGSTNRSGNNIGMTEQCANKEAAFAFIRFWCLTMEGRKIAFDTSHFFEQNFLPFLDDPIFDVPDEFFGEGYWEAQTISDQETPPYTVTKNWSQAVDILNKYVDSIDTGELTAEEGLKAAAEELRYMTGSK
jgi:ABC-type glycerol-3-phosphate transport system substrate-binding protein